MDTAGPYNLLPFSALRSQELLARLLLHLRSFWTLPMTDTWPLQLPAKAWLVGKLAGQYTVLPSASQLGQADADTSLTQDSMSVPCPSSPPPVDLLLLSTAAASPFSPTNYQAWLYCNSTISPPFHSKGTEDHLKIQK